MYTDPSGYAASTNVTETTVAATIAVMLASAVAFHDQAMMNIFTNLRWNLDSAAMLPQCTVTVTDWKNVILRFPAHDFDTKWIVTIPVMLSSWRLFKAINELKEADDEVETPGVLDKNEKELEESDDKLPNQGTVDGDVDGAPQVDAGKQVGEKGETGIRVHMDKKGNIHGYSVDPGRYLNGR